MRRFCLVLSFFAGCLSAQQASVSSTTAVDINGNRVTEGPEVIERTSPSGSEVTQKMQSINGRMVPIEQVEERVLRDDASGRVVERTTRPYDREGNPGQPTRETIEEQKGPNGNFTISTTTYRGDINGNMQLVQRSVTREHKSDSSETAETVIEKATLNGFETTEKRDVVKTKDPGGSYQEETNTFRKNASGDFYTAVRQTVDHAQHGSESTDNSAEYEIGSTGELQLHGQTVTKTVTHPNGSQDLVVDIYGPNVPGTVDGGGTQPLKLQEQQIIQKTPGPNKTVTETVNVRRPTISDPNTLGPEQQLSQTVCKGDCKP